MRMYPYRVGRAPFVLGILFLFASGYAQLPHIQRVFADVTSPCAGGVAPHLATAQEAASAPGGGITAGVTYVCPSDAQLGVSNDVGAAKQYLISIPKEKLSDCGTDPSIPSNIYKLNDSFAICAARFFQAYTQRYGGVVITSAYRDLSSGANACAGGATASNHTRGLAIDVKPAGTVAGQDQYKAQFQQMWLFASQNPQFGVCFPFQDHPLTGYPNGDWPHMILAGIGGSEGAKCAAEGVTQACSGSNFNPNSIQYPPAPMPNPSVQICSAFDLSCGQQMQQQCPYGQIYSVQYGICMSQQQQCPQGSIYTAYTNGCTPITQPQMPLQQSPMSYAQQQGSTGPIGTAGSVGNAGSFNPDGSTGSLQTCTPQYTCTNGAVYYRGYSCTTQISKTCSNGCNVAGTDCMGTSTSATTGTSSLSGMFNSLFGTLNGATSTPAPGPITLNPNVSNVISMTPPTTITTVANVPNNTFALLNGNIASIQPTSGGQTFTSTDLQNSPSANDTGATFGSAASAMTILENLKTVLTWILNHLQPFGGNVPSQGSAE